MAALLHMHVQDTRCGLSLTAYELLYQKDTAYLEDNLQLFAWAPCSVTTYRAVRETLGSSGIWTRYAVTVLFK